MLRHSLNNFEMQMYYQSQLRFEDIYSRNNLPKTMKDEACVINLDYYKQVGTRWIALYTNGNSFGVEQILAEIREIYRQQQHHNKYLQNTRVWPGAQPGISQVKVS